MDRTIRAFAERLVGAELGLYFCAGHGRQVGGVNDLVPVDAKLTMASALDFETLDGERVQNEHRHARRLPASALGSACLKGTSTIWGTRSGPRGAGGEAGVAWSKVKDTTKVSELVRGSPSPMSRDPARRAAPTRSPSRSSADGTSENTSSFWISRSGRPAACALRNWRRPRRPMRELQAPLADDGRHDAPNFASSLARRALSGSTATAISSAV